MFQIAAVAVGAVLGILGGLVVAAQYLEWWSYGNWNPVTLRYAVAYFTDFAPRFGGIRAWNLPLSGVLFGLGAFVVAIGIIKREWF